MIPLQETVGEGGQRNEIDPFLAELGAHQPVGVLKLWIYFRNGELNSYSPWGKDRSAEGNFWTYSDAVQEHEPPQSGQFARPPVRA